MSDAGYSVLCKVIIILSGMFSILGSVFNWDFFFNSRKARTFVNLIGRNGARIFYAVLGIVLIIVAIILI